MKTLATTAKIVFALFALALLLPIYNYWSAHHVRYSDSDRNAQRPAQITIAAAQRDIQYLADTMLSAYGGYFELGEHATREIFQLLKAKLVQSPNSSITTPDFALELAEALRPFQDGHLTISLQGEPNSPIATKSQYAAYLARQCDGIEPELKRYMRVEQVYDKAKGGVENTTLYFGPKLDLLPSCFRPIGQQGRPEGFALEDIDSEWLYLRIPSTYEAATLDQIKRATQQAQPIHKNLILDLRGNPGGQSHQVIDLLKKLGLPFRNPYGDGIRHTTPTSYQLRLNQMNDLRLSETERERYQRTVWEAYKKIALANPFNTSYEVSFDFDSPSETAFDKTIVIAMDSGCKSTCEGIVKGLRHYRRTTTIGTHSGGAVKIGDVVTVILPHSKMRVRFGLAYYPAFRHSREYSEVRGFSPDVWADLSQVTEKELVHIAGRL